MDLSKLPRLSKTEDPPPGASASDPPPVATAPPPAAAANYCLQCGAPLRAGARFCESCGARLAGRYAGAPEYEASDGGVAAEVWVSAIIGGVLMLIGRSFAGWLLATLAGHEYHTGVFWTDGALEGQEVKYWQLAGLTALSDSATFLFGLAMVLEAAALAAAATRFRHKVPLVAVALTITVLATAYNLFVAGKMFTINVLPTVSLLAVAFGGYIAFYEWRLLQRLRTTPSPRA